MAQPCPLDGSFGPAVGACRGGFDFTLSFEESILGLAPQTIFLLLTSFRYLTLRKRRVKLLKDTHLGFLKAFFCVLYILSSAILLVVWSRHEQFKTRTTIASLCLELLGSIAVTALSRLEHTRAIRPSHLLQFFLLLVLACNAVRLRTLFLMQYSNSVVASTSIHTFLIGFLLLLESLDKTPLVTGDHYSRLSPEDTIGLFAQKFFWHLNGLFRTGYRKILTLQDLHTISEELSSNDLRVSFQQAWTKQQNNDSRTAIYRAIWQALSRDILMPIIPRVLYMGTSLAQPFLITAMIRFVQDARKPATRNTGYGLIAAFALNYSLMAICNSWYYQSLARFSTKLRSCLISLVYNRTLRIHPKDVDVGAGTVLMNVDVEKVMLGTALLHEFWMLLLTCSIALYILYSQLGIAFIAPTIVSVIMVVVCYQIGKWMKPRQVVWTNATQKRVTAISYAVGNMKAIRLLGLSSIVHNSLARLREEEVHKQLYVRQLLTVILAIANNTFQITTLVTYVTFVTLALSRGTQFNFQVLFGSLSALKLVTSPLLPALQWIAVFTNSMASLERIQTYLRGDIMHNNSQAEGEELLYRDDANGIALESIPSSPISSSNPGSTIHLAGASFGVEDGQSLLTNLNLHINPATFNIIIGKVGSGKSLLLRSLIGEMWHDRGLAQLPTSGIAFCAQSPWLRNASIRDNVTGESGFDEDWYGKVTYACALDQDFEELRQGDQTLIGSKGISLSGGQKNRISLARAVYSRSPTIILDDVLSGLDKTTEQLVFKRIFGRSGLLRRSRSTVILATHSAHWAPEADGIIIMSSGTVSKQGCYQELASLPELSMYRKDGQNNDSTIDSEEIDQPIATSPKKALAIPAPGTDEIADEERRSGDRRSFSYYLLSIGVRQVIIYIGLLLLSQGTTTTQYIWLKHWAQSSNSGRGALTKNMVIFIIITVVNILLTSIWIAHFALVFMKRSSLALHAKQLNALMKASFSFIVATDIGSITNRFSQDMVLVDGPLPSAWVNVTSGIYECLSTFGIIAAATPPVAALVPFVCLVAWIIQRVYLRTSRQIRLMDLEAKAPLCTHFLETLAGVMTVRAFGWTEKYRQRNNDLLDQSQIPFYLLYAIQNWLKLVLELMVAGLVTVVVGIAVALRTKVDPGYLGLALVGAMDLGTFITYLVTCWTNLETSLSAISRIRRFSTETPPEEGEGRQLLHAPISWPNSGAISFKQFTASYSPEGETVLKDVCLDIKAGEKIGICGRTGSGKSSLVASLFGLLHHQSGTIHIDDVATTAISLDALRSKVVALPQEPFFLIDTSIRSNLRPWKQHIPSRPHVADETMVQALKEVGLWARLKEIVGPEQPVLDAPMSVVEGSLSQGEKQLFCLARATVTEGRIVVLDEATSSVDTVTDSLMQDVLRKAFGGRTILAIAHRLNTIMDFDRVVVMDGGRIVEVGEPGELVRREGSLFKALIERQGAL